MRPGLTSWLGRRGRPGAAGDRDELKLRPGSSFLLRRFGARA